MVAFLQCIDGLLQRDGVRFDDEDVSSEQCCMASPREVAGHYRVSVVGLDCSEEAPVHRLIRLLRVTFGRVGGGGGGGGGCVLGDVDEASLRRVVDLFIAAGVNGVTALGVTGEVARLDDAERRACSRSSSIRSTAGSASSPAPLPKARGPASNLQPPGQRSRRHRGHGEPAADAEAQLRRGRPPLHALADAVDIEIVVQDYPPISGYAMEPALLARIAREIPRARTIKLEDPPTPFKTSRILEQAGDPRCGSSAVSAACSCSRS